MVGGGPLQEELEKLALERAIPHFLFTGFIEKQEDIVPLFSTFDIFCLPTEKEGFGIALAEGSAMGIPVVACDSPPMNHVIEEGVSGFLAVPGDAESFSEKLRGLISKKELRVKMGEAGRSRVLSLFNEEVTHKNMLDDYQKLLSCGVENG